MKWYAKLYTRLVFIFLYLPIIVLIAFSFNESKSRASWTGFSFHWYKELFHNELILSSLRNTLIIALAASVIALVLGTMAAVGIYACLLYTSPSPRVQITGDEHHLSAHSQS